MLCGAALNIAPPLLSWQRLFRPRHPFPLETNQSMVVGPKVRFDLPPMFPGCSIHLNMLIPLLATLSKRSSRAAAISITGAPKATLLLLALHGAFQSKTLELFEGVHVRIGRQTSAKSTPSPNNGYFDSKVLSRTHAEVWCERNKVYIKDVKSSNGTFINGVRLSPEGEESTSVELNNGDQVEFGIDIMNEDGSGKKDRIFV